MTPQWIFRLVQPIVDLGFDLVGPCYTRQKMEGFLNRSVLSPLHRALYGEQLQNPVGPDFGLSGKLVQQMSWKLSNIFEMPLSRTFLSQIATSREGFL